MESMLPDESPLRSEGLKDARFDTTHLSVVLSAGHRSSPDSDAALESLCKTYWYPLYAYVRRRVIADAACFHRDTASLDRFRLNPDGKYRAKNSCCNCGIRGRTLENPTAQSQFSPAKSSRDFREISNRIVYTLSV